MENSVKTFLEAAARWNGSDDIDDAPFSEGDVVKTHQAVTDFGVSPTKIDGFFHLRDYQIAKGLRRGDLFVMDFGSYLLAATTAEGVIRGE